MKDILIIEKLGHRPKRVFKVRVPELADIGRYTSVRHIEGFRKRELQRMDRLALHHSMPWYSIDIVDDDLSMVQSAFEQSYTKPLPVPEEGQMLVYKWVCEVVQIEGGMPAFFKAIGYDYKTKKYLPDSLVAQHAN